MTRTHQGRIINNTLRIKTTPMRVWEAWADPQQIANWFVDRAEGRGDAGKTVRWFFDTFGYVMDVPVTESEPGQTFVTAGGDGPDGMPYLMEITISKDGGETVMHLVNSGFSEDPSKDESFKGPVSGWAHALTTMKVWLEQYPLRARHHDLVVRPVPHTVEQLRPFYATVSGRALWMPPDVAHAGDVLCDSGPELLLSLPGVDGIVALKSFAWSTGRMIGLDLSVWPAGGATAENAKPRLERALDRLADLLAKG
ncbi:MAG: SRPBCC domain-containing protein [Acidimicrobiia bacterium]